jgi:hypothetical protein
MKTPRELLQARHAQARPALDAQRRLALSHLRAPQPAGSWREALSRVWLDLIVPARVTWLGIAAAWTVILALYWQAERPAQNLANPPLPPDLASQLAEQRQLIAELTQAGSQPPPTFHRL